MNIGLGLVLFVIGIVLMGLAAFKVQADRVNLWYLGWPFVITAFVVGI